VAVGFVSEQTGCELHTEHGVLDDPRIMQALSPVFQTHGVVERAHWHGSMKVEHAEPEQAACEGQSPQSTLGPLFTFALAS